MRDSGSTDPRSADGRPSTRATLGYKPRYKEGYFPVAPIDSQQDLRTEMCRVMDTVGIQVERQHHEVATAGQAEIDIRFDTLTRTADKLMWFKYITKNVALRNGKTVTFMPKPLFGDNGSGMHTHQSIWKGGKPLFAGEGYAGMSEMAMHYIGGVLKHARALAALCNPTTNSYKRLVPGFEAPVNLAYSSRNRSAAIRIPMYSPSPKAKRLEFRSPDPSCNPYLAFAAMLMAGLDGIENRVDPGDPLDKDIYGLSPPVSRTALAGVSVAIPTPEDGRPSTSAGCGQFAPDLPRQIEKALITSFADAGAQIALRAPWRLAVALTFAGAGAEYAGSSRTPATGQSPCYSSESLPVLSEHPHSVHAGSARTNVALR